MNLLQAVYNALRLPELRNKLLFTAMMLIIFRLFANIAVPGANTVALAAGQAYGLTVLFQNSNPAVLPANMEWFTRLAIILTLTSGCVMLMWFGELITEYGIGNGISLIIFAGIIARGPRTLVTTVQSHTTGAGVADYLPFIVFGLIALRVTQAGVIPIIFAISIMFFPTILANYFAAAPPDTVFYKASAWIRTNFVPNGPNITMDIVYNALYFLFVFGFTYFYTAVTFDVYDVADNLKRYSSFIPGIRPGVQTARYLGSVLNRVTFAGACFLGFITVVLPILTSRITGIGSQQLYLGGTAILIVVGVALDTMKQLEPQLFMRQSRGFIR